MFSKYEFKNKNLLSKTDKYICANIFKGVFLLLNSIINEKKFRRY